MPLTNDLGNLFSGEYGPWIIGAIVAVAGVLIGIICNYRLHHLPYKKRPLLTNSEYIFWKEMYPKMRKAGVIVCPKVRMEDFLVVNVSAQKKGKRQAFRNRIKSRHIDFILCDKDLNMIAGVELDDKSHKYNASTIEGDVLKNQIFKDIGIRLFRVPTSKEGYAEEIDDIINTLRRTGLI